MKNIVRYGYDGFRNMLQNCCRLAPGFIGFICSTSIRCQIIKLHPCLYPPLSFRLSGNFSLKKLLTALIKRQEEPLCKQIISLSVNSRAAWSQQNNIETVL